MINQRSISAFTRTTALCALLLEATFAFARPAPDDLTNSMLVEVRTFIHQKSIPGPAPLCGGLITFDGDNRGPTAFPRTSRTEFVLSRQFANFQGRASNVRYVQKNVGTTVGHFPLFGSRSGRASSSGMRYTSSSTATTHSWKLDHDMQNPLCVGVPAINYKLTVDVTKSGQVRVRGVHDQFPDIEVWAVRHGGLWKRVYFSPGNNPLCLADALPGCAKKSVDVTSRL